MKTRKPKEVKDKIELTRENYKGLKNIAKESGLKLEQVVDLILACELGIIEYVVWKRLKLLKRLKIEPTTERLYHNIL